MNFLDTFSKNAQISYLVKVRPVGGQLLHADRQANRRTDMNIIVAFRKFVKAPKYGKWQKSVGLSWYSVPRSISTGNLLQWGYEPILNVNV